MIAIALKARRGLVSAHGRFKVLLALALLAVYACPAALAQSAEPAVLQSVDIGNLPGGRVQLRFQLSKPVPEPETFTINEPARIVVDFVDVGSALGNNQQTINQGVAERVTVLEGSDRTRAAINLAGLVPYSIKTQGNAVLLTLEASGGGGASNVARASGPASSEAVASSGSGVDTIDFRRGVEGQGIISVMLSDPSVTVDVREEGTKVVADFAGVSLPREQQRRLDVTDFATPVTLIDALNRNGSARISIDRVGESEFLAYQTDGRYTIEIRPVIEEEEPDDPANKEYTGELLSLNFQDIEVRAVLQILADFTGLNIVVSDTVQGNLTLRLQNVPWDQALDIILRTKGLTQRQNGTVVYIAPTEEVAAREKLELEAEKQREGLVPVRTEVIQVNYAKAEDLKELIEDRGSRGGVEQGDSENASLLSARGQVSADLRTNSLLVQDIPQKLTEIRALVNTLDVPVRQVLIDARVVIARDDFSKELGVRIGASGIRPNDANGATVLGGNLSGTDTVLGNPGIPATVLDNLHDTNQPFPVRLPGLADRLGVNLPVAGFGSLALAILGRDYLLDLELSALQAEDRGETLSNPRVVTTDRQEAIIKQGEEIPYETISEDGTRTEFRDAVLELKVLPQITPDGRIIMDLAVKKDERGQVAPNGALAINKREVQTQVLVDNGDTVVLGGVFEKVTSAGIDKVPFFGDIPAIGRLFRRNRDTDSKFELLIFVKPQIITSGVAVR